MATELQYTTSGGDAFDSISWTLFKTEKYMAAIILANPGYADVVNFDAGIVLTIPVVPYHPNVSAVPWGTLIQNR
jgi:phage tail protein X